MNIHISIGLDKATQQMLQTMMQLLIEIKKQGAKNMAAIDDLNKAIQDEDVSITSLTAVVTKVDADISALIAKIQAGGLTPQQIADALSAIQSHTASIKTAVDVLGADDTKANA